jgi:hypothetical protein
MCLPDALEPADISKILKVAAQGGERLEQLCWWNFSGNSINLPDVKLL